MSYFKCKRIYVLGILVAWLSAVSMYVAHAAAPMAKTMAPGFYRMMLGDFEITEIGRTHV